MSGSDTDVQSTVSGYFIELHFLQDTWEANPQWPASIALRPHIWADQCQFGHAGLQSQLQQAEKDRAELLQICHGKLAGIPGA